MHFFDPTVDWPRELLDPPVPDLFLVLSKTSVTSNSPWNNPSESSSWNTPWIEYAALDREERFVNMTIFNTQSASRDEKKRISERSDSLDDETRTIGWYKSTSPIDECFAILQRTNLIQFWKTKSLPDRQAPASSESPIVFRKMRSPPLKQPLDQDWDYLMIETLDETSDMEFATASRWEAELDQPTEGSSKDRPVDQSVDQAEMLKLYIVASSRKLDPGQPTGGGLPGEMETTT